MYEKMVRAIAGGCEYLENVMKKETTITFKISYVMEIPIRM